jgi:aryl-alcohol dehydrogenase-like predicted oxidoreductase
MKYVKLGHRGPVVSTVGFGAWAIGGMNWGKTDDDVSRAALHAALDAGVTLIDTADVYGFGHSEELIAQVLVARGGKKDDLIVATKAGSDFYNAAKTDDKGYGPIKPNYSKSHLVFAAEQSLRRLGLDVLDILQLHSPELALLERDEPWDALHTLKRQGKIRHAGWSVQSFKESEQAHLLDRHHDLVGCIQVRYNLLEREAERVLFPRAQQYGIGVIVRIPILFGVLADKFSRQTRFAPEDHRSMNLSPEKLDAHLAQLEQIQPRLLERNPRQSLTQVALRFCITHPACQTVIPGAKTSQQVAENCSASDLDPLTGAEIQPLRVQPPA